MSSSLQNSDLFQELFSFADLFDPQIEEMERKFEGKHLYKYYSELRTDVLLLPRLRFSQKTALNDPFELTKRWQEIGGPSVQKILVPAFKSALRRELIRKFSDKDAFIAEQEKKNNLSLTPQQRAEIRRHLDSQEAQKVFSKTLNDSELMVDMLFEQFAQNGDAVLEKIISETGIFSVSESPTNEQLWALYASEGRGFCLALNTKHKFFRTAKSEAKGWPLFHKVTYTDEKIDDFWRNPYYLFAVKKKKWSFEEEWRMMKSRSECDAVEFQNGQELFLCNVKPGMIDSVIFGYRFNAQNAAQISDAILKFDPEIKIKKAILDVRDGNIKIAEV